MCSPAYKYNIYCMLVCVLLSEKTIHPLIILEGRPTQQPPLLPDSKQFHRFHMETLVVSGFADQVLLIDRKVRWAGPLSHHNFSVDRTSGLKFLGTANPS